MTTAATPPAGSLGTLVVGASQAGIQLAITMRELGYAHPIVVVGAEAEGPYQRPPLSKAFLAGTADAEALELRAPAFYADRDIRLVLGERVTTIRFAGGAGTASTDAGTDLSFDRLALTVGARPRILSIPGAELDGVGYLRTMADARTLRTRLAHARSVVVIGGGFIGLEAAAAARSRGAAVTVLETTDRLIARAVAPVVSEFYRAAHERRGTRVRLGVGVAEILGSGGHVSGVRLADGEVVPADVVLIGIGVLPRLELAEQLGLACAGGVVVDEFARTSHPRVVAAGDCAALPHPLTGVGLVRLESVQNAVDQAKVAAATLVADAAHRAGAPREDLSAYRAVPWFWSDQGDLKLQIAGLSTGYDAVVVRGEPASERFSVLYYAGGRLLAIDAINSAVDYLTVRRALGRGEHLPADRVADTTTTLKALLVGAPVPAGARP